MMTIPDQYEEVNELLFKREQEHGDSDVIMIAGLLSGRTGEVFRSYVFEKLHAVHIQNRAAPGAPDVMCEECGRPQTDHKAGMLDTFAMHRVRKALEEHADDPVGYLAEVSGNTWK